MFTWWKSSNTLNLGRSFLPSWLIYIYQHITGHIDLKKGEIFSRIMPSHTIFMPLHATTVQLGWTHRKSFLKVWFQGLQYWEVSLALAPPSSRWGLEMALEYLWGLMGRGLGGWGSECRPPCVCEHWTAAPLSLSVVYFLPSDLSPDVVNEIVPSEVNLS